MLSDLIISHTGHKANSPAAWSPTQVKLTNAVMPIKIRLVSRLPDLVKEWEAKILLEAK